jgi:hypothetical protein
MVRRPLLSSRRLWAAIAILTVVVAYVATVTPGHAFEADDFAAYVMQARNLVEGRAYSDIHNVPNPHALSVAPPQGYPPMYPLLLAPVYKIWGLNLRIMKIATVFCFGLAMAAFALLFENELPGWAISAAIVLMGFNLAFWEQRDYLVSEFTYLMFSLGALLAAQKFSKNLDPREWRYAEALVLSVLLYAAYGTRTIGITLLPAVILAGLWKFQRPSRFLLVVVACTSLLILMQNALFVSPKAYLNAAHPSVAITWQHVIYYGKTLSYLWRNGMIKILQIFLAGLFTVLAGVGFLRRLWARKSATEFYVAGYAALLCVWTSDLGMRGLLPVLPLYFAYALAEMIRMFSRLARPYRFASVATLSAVIVLTYAAAFHEYAHRLHLPDVSDPQAQELFRYVKANTNPADLLVMQQPRTLALFTDRFTTVLAPGDSVAVSERFLAGVHARYLIYNDKLGLPIQELIDSKVLTREPLFQNSEFAVYAVQ